MENNTQNKTLHKNSRQRNALLSLLCSTKTHPTATWLFENLKQDFPNISPGTVYRNLTVLSKQGKVRILRSGSLQDRFDGNASTHYHVQCEKCGKIEDLDLPVDPGQNAQAETVSGYRIVAHRLDFYGICPDCQKSGKNKDIKQEEQR